MTVSKALIAALWILPIAMGFVLRGRRRVVARWMGIAVAALLVPIAFVIFVSSARELLTTPSIRALAVRSVAVDDLSAVLLPLVTSLTLAVLIASPKSDLDGASVRAVLLAEGATLGVLVSANTILLALFWTLSYVPMLIGDRHPRSPAHARTSRRATYMAIGFGVLPFVGALVAGTLVPPPADGVPMSALAYAAPVLLLIACTARMGIFPFHSWIPVLLERGRLVVMLPAIIISPIGSYVLVRLGLGLFPRAMAGLSGVLMTMAVASSVYGAVVALGQDHGLRQVGYLWTSFAGFVLAGIGSLEARGLSGALAHDFSLTIAMAGMLLTLRAVEARTGTIDSRVLGNLVTHAPRMATTYFVLGLAAIGFPTMVTFVSEDLVVQGLIRSSHPVITIVLLSATAINGVTLVRSFKRIFLGPPSLPTSTFTTTAIADLLPRERWIAALLILSLIAFGFAPAPLLTIRRGVEHMVVVLQKT